MLYQNQFSMTEVKGKLDLAFNMNTIPCEIDSSEHGTLVHGQAVKMADVAGGAPKVVAVSADDDAVFGFINFNLKDKDFVAYKKVEVSIKGNVMYMEASAAIARGAKVAVVVSGQKVVTASGSMTVIGWAMDKAAQAGDLIRVYIETPAIAQPIVMSEIVDLPASVPFMPDTALVASNFIKVNAGATAIEYSAS